MTADLPGPGADDERSVYEAFRHTRRYDAVAELVRSFLNGGNAGLFDVRHTKRNHRTAP